MDNVLYHVEYMYAAAHNLVLYDLDYDRCFVIADILSDFVLAYVIDDDDYLLYSVKYDFSEFSRMGYVMLGSSSIRTCSHPYRLPFDFSED